MSPVSLSRPPGRSASSRAARRTPRCRPRPRLHAARDGRRGRRASTQDAAAVAPLGACWVAASPAWSARLGRNGVSSHRREGDGTTPLGTFRVRPDDVRRRARSRASGSATTASSAATGGTRIPARRRTTASATSPCGAEPAVRRRERGAVDDHRRLPLVRGRPLQRRPRRPRAGRACGVGRRGRCRGASGRRTSPSTTSRCSAISPRPHEPATRSRSTSTSSSGSPATPSRLAVVDRLRELAPNLAGLKVSDSPFDKVRPYLVDGLDLFVGAEALIGEASPPVQRARSAGLRQRSPRWWSRRSGRATRHGPASSARCSTATSGSPP